MALPGPALAHGWPGAKPSTGSSWPATVSNDVSARLGMCDTVGCSESMNIANVYNLNNDAGQEATKARAHVYNAA